MPVAPVAPTDRLGVLIAAYEYELGSCFRCPRRQLQVTRLGEITSEEGETPLYACRQCVEDLLAMHERSVGREGPRPYILQLPRVPRE
ncbi:hypothetical protein ACFU9Y_03890 [Streptomyces sp. NPDC057621]|uniref:hypothetical protein n=1 Tax=Streptomyces sp. NPDC057621 TaxID=3346186 RepID=UPI00369AB88B